MRKSGLSRSTVDILHSAAELRNPRGRYNLFRRNADLRLLDDGIYNTGRVSGSGQLYYEHAATHATESGIGKPIVSLMERLNHRYGDYVTILDSMRIEFMNFAFDFLSRGEVHRIQREAYEDAKPQLREIALDKFLESYGKAMNAKSPIEREAARRQTERFASELKKIDPTFIFGGF